MLWPRACEGNCDARALCRDGALAESGDARRGSPLARTLSLRGPGACRAVEDVVCAENNAVVRSDWVLQDAWWPMSLALGVGMDLAAVASVPGRDRENLLLGGYELNLRCGAGRVPLQRGVLICGACVCGAVGGWLRHLRQSLYRAGSHVARAGPISPTPRPWPSPDRAQLLSVRPPPACLFATPATPPPNTRRVGPAAYSVRRILHRVFRRAGVRCVSPFYPGTAVPALPGACGSDLTRA